MDEREILAAVESFYAAAIGQGTWPAALELLLAVSGFAGGALYLFDRESQANIKGVWHRLDTAVQHDYETEYFHIDPRTPLVFGPQRPRLLYDYRHTPEDQIDRDPYYAWYMRSQGMRY